MTRICSHCKTVNNGDPLLCNSCGSQLRRQKLNGAGRLLMSLLVIGWVITPIACIRLVYLLIFDSSFGATTFAAQLGAWIVFFWVYLHFLELFEGFAKPR